MRATVLAMVLALGFLLPPAPAKASYYYVPMGGVDSGCWAKIITFKSGGRVYEYTWGYIGWCV